MGLFLFTLAAVGLFLILLVPVNYLLAQIVVRDPRSVFRHREPERRPDSQADTR
jgi:hypothetical protein